MLITRLRRGRAAARRRLAAIMLVSALAIGGSQLGLPIASAGEDGPEVTCPDGQHVEAGICTSDPTVVATPDGPSGSGATTGPSGSTGSENDAADDSPAAASGEPSSSTGDGAGSDETPPATPKDPEQHGGSDRTAGNGGRHIDICHATGNGGYVSNSPSISATGDINGGHQNHGNDIIPPFDTDGDTTGITPLNWDAEHQAIWNNDCQVPGDGPDVSISKTANVDGSISPGDSFTYTIVVTNAGGASANVGVNDEVPDPLVVNGATSSDLDCGVDGNSVTCTGDVPVEGSATITVSVTLPSEGTCPDTISNTATVDAGSGGEVAAASNQDSAQAVVTVDCTKITICHATGNGQYVTISPSASGVYHGHLEQHGDDIIPPFEFDGTTYQQNWDAGGQAIFDNDCQVPEGDVTITKSASVEGPVSPGQSFTYTVTVANTNGSDAPVTVTDDVPSAFGVDDATSSDLACDVDGNSVSCSGDVPANGSATVTISVTTSESLEFCGGSYTNTATLNLQPQGDAVSEVDGDTADATVSIDCPQTDLSITKSADATDVAEDDTFHYTITVANGEGAGEASGIGVVDNLPAGIALDAVDGGGADCSATSGTQVSCTIGSLAGGESVTITLTVHPNGEACGEIVNTATFAPTVDRPQLRVGHTLSAFVENIFGEAELSSNQAVVTVDCTHVRICHETGNGGFTSISPSASGVYHGHLQQHADDIIPPFEYQGTSYQQNWDAAGQATWSNDCEPVPGAGIEVEKTGPDSAETGDGFVFTITVTNTGEVPVTDVSVTDDVPTGLEVQAGSLPDDEGHSCQAEGNWVSCHDSSTLNPGDSVTFTIPVVVTSDGGCTTVTNTANAAASIAAVIGDPFRGASIDQDGTVEGSGSWSVDLNCGSPPPPPPSPILDLTKTADADHVESGGQIGFTITLTNEGPGNATNVTLTDAMPGVGGLQWQAPALPTGCSLNDNTLSCSFATMAAGASVTIHVTATSPAGLCGTITNVAVASGTNTVRTSGSDSVTLDCVSGISVSKTGPEKALVGQTITYTITVQLIDGSPAVSGITVTDPVCDSAPVGPSGDGGTAGLLESGETWTYTCTHRVTANDPDPLVNTVLVSGDGADGTDAHVVDIIHPSIDLEKSADVRSASPGETVHYRYDVTNTGDVDLSDISVDDDVMGPICAFPSLEPGATRTCRGRYVVPANAPVELTNVAVVTAFYAAPASSSVTSLRAKGLAGPSNVVTDSDQVTIAIVAGVTVTPDRTRSAPRGLAFTGSAGVIPLATVALGLLLIGTGLVLASRRRRVPTD